MIDKRPTHGRFSCVQLGWNIAVHLPGGLPMFAKDLDTAKAEFKVAWEALKARTTPDQLAAAYAAMNIRDDNDDESPDDK